MMLVEDEGWLTLNMKGEKSMTEKSWNGSTPTNCHVCKEPLNWVANKQWFVDGRLKGQDSWCLMCPRCFEHYGVGLGIGKGQKYSVIKPYEKLER